MVAFPLDPFEALASYTSDGHLVVVSRVSVLLACMTGMEGGEEAEEAEAAPLNYLGYFPVLERSLRLPEGTMEMEAEAEVAAEEAARLALFGVHVAAELPSPLEALVISLSDDRVGVSSLLGYLALHEESAVHLQKRLVAFGHLSNLLTVLQEGSPGRIDEEEEEE